jgi:hypothetical protein
VPPISPEANPNAIARKTINWRSRFSAWTSILHSDQTEHTLFTASCIVAEIHHECGKPTLKFGQEALEASCRELIREIGIDAVRRSIRRGFDAYRTQDEGARMKSSQTEQAERKRFVGSNQATTYHQLANVDVSLGGRFAAGGEVSGAEEATRYPAQPESSPWAADPTGVEPPLGYAIDEQAPVGEFAEIAASLDRLGSGESEAATDPAPPPVPLAAGQGGVMGLADAPSASQVERSVATSLRDLLQRMVVRK